MGPESVLGLLRDGGGTYTRQPFSDETLVLVEKSGSSLIVLERKATAERTSGEFRLHRIDLAGDTILSRSYDYEPVAIPVDTVEGAVESIADDLHGFVGERTGSTLAQMRGLVREAMYKPGYYPPIANMLAGRDGTTWLARNPATEQGAEWLILDREGESIGRAIIPSEVRVLAADTSALWGVVRDDLDVEYIVRYRLEFP